MLEQEIFRVDDPGRIRDLARAHPWATLISHTPDRGLVVSHLPVLVDDSRQDAGDTRDSQAARSSATSPGPTPGSTNSAPTRSSS